MAGDVNKVILIGRLGQDPESRGINDTTVTTLSVATSRKWKSKDGETQEATQWHRVNAWGKLGEICSQYLTKGRQVYVEGELQYRKYEKDGVTMYGTDIRASEVKFLGSSPKGGEASLSNDNEEPF